MKKNNQQIGHYDVTLNRAMNHSVHAQLMFIIWIKANPKQTHNENYFDIENEIKSILYVQ